MGASCGSGCKGHSEGEDFKSEMDKPLANHAYEPEAAVVAQSSGSERTRRSGGAKETESMHTKPGHISQLSAVDEARESVDGYGGVPPGTVPSSDHKMAYHSRHMSELEFNKEKKHKEYLMERERAKLTGAPTSTVAGGESIPRDSISSTYAGMGTSYPGGGLFGAQSSTYASDSLFSVGDKHQSSSIMMVSDRGSSVDASLKLRDSSSDKRKRRDAPVLSKTKKSDEHRLVLRERKRGSGFAHRSDASASIITQEEKSQSPNKDITPETPQRGLSDFLDDQVFNPDCHGESHGFRRAISNASECDIMYGYSSVIGGRSSAVGSDDEKDTGLGVYPPWPMSPPDGSSMLSDHSTAYVIEDAH